MNLKRMYIQYIRLKFIRFKYIFIYLEIERARHRQTWTERERAE